MDIFVNQNVLNDFGTNRIFPVIELRISWRGPDAQPVYDLLEKIGKGTKKLTIYHPLHDLPHFFDYFPVLEELKLELSLLHILKIAPKILKKVFIFEVKDLLETTYGELYDHTFKLLDELKPLADYELIFEEISTETLFKRYVVDKNLKEYFQNRNTEYVCCKPFDIFKKSRFDPSDILKVSHFNGSVLNPKVEFQLKKDLELLPNLQELSVDFKSKFPCISFHK